MTTELTILAWTLVLALVQIMLTATLRTAETGPGYNMSARDSEGPPVGVVTGRMMRAQKNLFETLPLFIAAILIAHVAGRNNTQTLYGATLYLAARVLYVPLYAFGVPVARTIIFIASLSGLLMVILASLIHP